MKTLKYLDAHLEEILCVFALMAMTLVIFIQIIIRGISSFVTIPMAWTEEFGRYLFIYAVYLGAALATRNLAHQKVDILLLLCGDKGKLVLNLISDIGVLVFAGFMTVYSWQVVRNVAFVFVQRAPATKINMGLAYAAPALGMTLCAYRSLQNVVFHVKSYRNARQGSVKKVGGGD